MLSVIVAATLTFTPTELKKRDDNIFCSAYCLHAEPYASGGHIEGQDCLCHIPHNLKALKANVRVLAKRRDFDESD